MTTPVLPRDLYPVTSPSGYSYASAQGVHMTQVEGALIVMQWILTEAKGL